jgi:small-conductance mechanosensitive channel/CRP-like cAMP-binding protein
MDAGLNWLAGSLFLLSCLLWLAMPAERKQLLPPILLSGFGLALWGLMLSLAASFRFPTWCGKIGTAAAEVAVVHLAADVLLPRLTRNRISRIYREILIGAGYVGVFLILLTRLGVNLTGIVTTSAVATAVIGLSLQETLANLAAGVALQTGYGITEGDWIKTTEGVGRVVMIRMRCTTIETVDNERVLIPNTLLVKAPVVIVGTRHRRIIPFGMSYTVSPSRIVEAVRHVLRAARMEGIAEEPAPDCVILEFQQHAVQYAVLLWITSPGRDREAISDALTRIYFALERLGAPLTQVPQVVEWQRRSEAVLGIEASLADRVALLRNIDLFGMLSIEETQKLAARLKRERFGPGEVILRQGEGGTTLFIVAHGRIRILVSGQSGSSMEVATLEERDFFGEMSLLTGEPRAATAIAVNQTDCWIVEQADLQDLLDQRPELAADFATVLTERRTGLQAARERLSQDEAASLQAAQRGLMTRIQEFFGIKRAAVKEAG